MRLFVVLLAALPALAQYSIGTLYRPLAVPTPAGGNTCSRTWYDPDIHLLPNGTDLGILAQASVPTYCTDVAVDTIQRATRENAGGRWTVPRLVDGYANECPTVQGQYTRCGFEHWFHSGPVASPSVVRLPNENSPTGVRYYMAFVGGNADYIHGKIYWAVSDDGKKWDTYARNATEFWAPVIFAKRGEPECSAPSGIGQVQLAFENGLFYMFFQYYHPKGELSSVLYRFDYNPKHPFGFGGSVRELYLDGAWQRHSGQLLWEYDTVAIRTEEAVMGLYDGAQTAGFGFGQGDVKFGNGRWLHLYVFAHVMYAQTATSLDPTVATWSVPEVVDVSRIRAAYPLSTSAPAPGVWYGSLSGTPEKWWIWTSVPFEDRLCAGNTIPVNPFAGLALLPAVLCTPDRPCD